MKISLYTLLAVGFLIVSGCSKTEQDKAFLENLGKDDPLQEAFQVKFIFSEKAVVQAILEAPHVEVVLKNQQEVSIFDRGVHLKFFTETGEPRSDLTANYGEFKKDFGVAMVRGNVVVVNEKGERMETEMLEWDSERDSIYTREFVKIYTENEIIYGDGIRAKSDFSAYKFYNIRGSMRLKEGEPAPAIPTPQGGNPPSRDGGNP